MIDQGEKVWLGIDPGQTGAIALITKDLQQAETHDYPQDVDNCAELVRKLKLNFRIQGAAIEKVNAMPGQGVSSMFKFGGNYFGWRGILASNEIPYQLVTPQKWQKAVGALPKDKKKRKNEIKAYSQRLYPHLKVTLYNADALAMLSVFDKVF